MTSMCKKTSPYLPWEIYCVKLGFGCFKLNFNQHKQVWTTNDLSFFLTLLYLHAGKCANSAGCIIAVWVVSMTRKVLYSCQSILFSYIGACSTHMIITIQMSLHFLFEKNYTMQNKKDSQRKNIWWNCLNLIYIWSFHPFLFLLTDCTSKLWFECYFPWS